MVEQDEQLNLLLKEFAGSELDGQLGRAERSFRQHVRSMRQEAWRRRSWMIGAFASGMAASIALMWSLPLLRTGVRPANAPGPITPAEPTIVPSVERIMQSNVSDEGVVILNNDEPFRMLRRQQLQQTRWFDRANAVKAQESAPQDDVLLIRLPTY